MIRTAWLLYRLCRKLHLDDPYIERRGVSIGIAVEPQAHYNIRCELAKARGEPPPMRTEAVEVTYSPIMGVPTYTQRAPTLAEALSKALDAPFPASLA